jgi:hypothetical protein
MAEYARPDSADTSPPSSVVSRFFDRITSPPGALAFGVSGAVAVFAVWHIFRDDAAPGRDSMATLAAVDVGLLIALAVETFGSHIKTAGQKSAAAAGRTMPAAFGLLLALLASVDRSSARTERWIAAIVFLLTTSGVLSVIFSALDRAEDAAVENAPTSHAT